MTKTTRILAIILAILAALAGAAVWYGNNQRRAYLEAKGAASVLAKQYQDYKAKSDPIILTLQEQSAKDRADKLAAVERANAAEASKDRLSADLSAEKAKTAALTPDALSGSISLRVGAGEITPNQGGLYIFTRRGAESVLNLILDGEGYAKQYQAERTVSTNLRAALNAADHEASNLSQRLYITTNERDKAVLAWDADKAALKSLERSILGTKVKTFLIGAGAGAAAVIIFNLVRGK